MREAVEDLQAIQATREPDRGTWLQRQEQVQVLQGPCPASDAPLRQHRGRVRASLAPGLFVGGEAAALPQANLDLERWCRPPTGHERRLQGPQHAGGRLVHAGPTLLLALEAHWAHPAPVTAVEFWPYRRRPAPACQRQALQRRTIRRRARSKKKRPLLLAELAHRSLEGP
jgi:hypothetical protein